MVMHSLWRRIQKLLTGRSHQSRRRYRSPAPALRILRLERRRVLSADFSLGASGLVLQGFDADDGEVLSISQMDSEYHFTLGKGDWNDPGGALQEGIRLDGQTLSIDSSIVGDLVNGITVLGDENTPLEVNLGQADFSWLQGPLSFEGVRSLNQAVDTQFAVSESFAMEVNALEAGMTIGSLNVAGDLIISSFGPIVDGVGTEINVTGNATFISRALHPAADFDNDGIVTDADLGAWSANFGLGLGATKADGDANGDSAVNIADWIVWRNSLGQISEPGGIFLADNLTDQLNVGGTATFEAQDGGSRFQIEVGLNGTTNFGSLAVIGENVSITEDSSTVLVGVDAASFELNSTGSITDAPGTTLSIAGLASFDAGANPITLGDELADTTNFGQLYLAGGDVSVMEDSGTELTGVLANSLSLTSDGPITDAPGTTIAVNGLALFDAGSNSISLGDNAADTTNFGQLHLTGGVVSISEDSGTELSGVSATAFSLNSNGPISDTPNTSILVSGLASLNSGGDPIILGDNAGDTTNFGQLNLTGGAISITEDSGTELVGVSAASLNLTSDGPITDALGTVINVNGLATLHAGANAITLGDNPADITNFGQLNLSGGTVSIVEDSATVLTGVMASTFHLTSNGPISDAAGTTITVTGLATLHAGANSISLGDNPADTTNFGQLNMTGGAIAISEDSGTELTGISATTLNLTSAGTITDIAGTTINVSALATFHAGANSITLGDSSGDTTNFGQLNVTGGGVSVMEDSGTELTGVMASSLALTSSGPITDAAGTSIVVSGLATFHAGANAITLGDNGGDTTNFGQLNLTGGAVSVMEDSGTELTGVMATTLNLASNGPITDTAGTTISVVGLATLNAGTNGTTLGDNASDTTNFGQLHLTGGAISIAEDSATVLTHVTATTLNLVSAGSITDTPNTTIDITGLATINAGANAITLGDNAGDSTNFGQLNVSGGTVSVTEDSGTELTGAIASTLNLTSNGPITDAAGTTISVTGLATLNTGANAIILGDNVADTTNFGQLNLTGGAVTIMEDSGTHLTGVMATSLNLTSNGTITDEPGTTISVTGLATLHAGAHAITLGDNTGDTTNFGQLHLTGGAVAISEDSATVLTHVTSASLTLTSIGSITDAPNTTINISGLATFNAGANGITLGDNASDTTNFGSLNLTGGGVAVTEDSATVLTGISASSLILTSAGSITDVTGTTIDVNTTASFLAGAEIVLADAATDELSVGGLATFRAGAAMPFFDITIGAAGTVNFGMLHLTGHEVVVQEDSATDLAGVTAMSLELESAGAITDTSTAVIFVNGPAAMLADGKITLADMGPANSVIVVGLGSFQVSDGNNIDIGVVPANGFPAAANAQLGSLQFTAMGGMVRVSLDGPIILSGSGSGGGSEADQAELATTPGSDGDVVMNDLIANGLQVRSDGAIRDAADSDVQVTDTATMVSRRFTTLADQGLGNRFAVGGLASFTSLTGQPIDLGVSPSADPHSPSRGIGTDATLTLGSFSMQTAEGDFTANLDNAVLLDGQSLAGSVVIVSSGAITDAATASTTITSFAILEAAEGSDIVLGDQAAEFRVAEAGTTVPIFDASRFLALKAENVSIQADSGINLSTSADFNEFNGTVFLSAEGNISQVAHIGEIQALTSNRIAMLSAAAVLFSQVRVSSQVTGDATTAPNLAIRGGVPVPISIIPASQFPVDIIPSSTITEYSPIGYDPAGTEMPRPDGSGLNDLTGARIMEPSAIGDGYSIIMKVLGDAKIGVVSDATGAQADIVGVSVTDQAGNAFLQTLADDGSGSGQSVPVPAVPEAGDIVFTSQGSGGETTVQMTGGVFTAVAAGELTIDTDQPDSAVGSITTKLTSATGTVTSVEGYTTYDGRIAPTAANPLAETDKIGPHLVLDAPSEIDTAATTGLVLSPEFEQRVTIVAGSRGENNLVLELEWADVEFPRDGGPSLTGVDGTNPNPDVMLVPESVDAIAPQALTQSSVPPLDFRAVTVRHSFSEAFIPDNPSLPLLPTTIRLYNDPAINLFDQGGSRNLNVVDNFVQPRVIAVPTAGFYIISSAQEPAAYDPPTVTPVPNVSIVPQSRIVVDEIRAVTSSEAEVIKYGRVENGEFVKEEGWPKELEGRPEGDFLSEIREQVNESPALEGDYRIISETPRGTQQLDEWVKGDEETDEGQGAEGEKMPEDEQIPEVEAAPDGENLKTNGSLKAEPGNVPAISVLPIEEVPLGYNSSTECAFVGAAVLAAPRLVGRESSGTKSGIDLSRAARRRRAWQRLARENG